MKGQFLAGLLFLFCMDFMEQQKSGFEQPVPRALRPAGQKRPGGAFFYWIEHSSAQVSSASASISSPAAARSGSSCCIRRRPS